jgi:hypothetical protein
MFAALSLLCIGLFHRGDGGRHDWMRFHANDVACPRIENNKPCLGILNWKNNDRKFLVCDVCRREFTVFVTAKVKRT